MALMSLIMLAAAKIAPRLKQAAPREAVQSYWICDLVRLTIYPASEL